MGPNMTSRFNQSYGSFQALVSRLLFVCFFLGPTGGLTQVSSKVLYNQEVPGPSQPSEWSASSTAF